MEETFTWCQREPLEISPGSPASVQVGSVAVHDTKLSPAMFCVAQREVVKP